MSKKCEELRLVWVYNNNRPDVSFPVCDFSESVVFLDPLTLSLLHTKEAKEENSLGLYAIGGEPTVERMLQSYRWGIFPWFAYKDDESYWYCPEMRYVIFPDKIHVGHTLRNLLNKGKYHITINKAFREVIHNCRMVDDRDEIDGAWLGPELENLFITLHEMGYAKSVEVWEGDELVGGFYGFFQNGVFQGESMFSLRPSASQIGLILLCRNPYIDGTRIKLIDTQYETPTFKKLGGEYIPYKTYREIMEDA